MSENHGGKRKGAGRKSEDGAYDLFRVSVSVTQQIYDMLLAKGEGNVSLGLRRLCISSAKSTTPVRLKSVAKKKPAPVYIEPDEFTPEGSRRNLLTMRRLRAEAQEQYEQALAEYVEE